MPARPPAATGRSIASWRRRRIGAVLIAVTALITGAGVACSADTSSSPPSRSEIAGLLTRQSAAVLHRDRTSYLSDLAPGGYRTRQGSVFDNLARLRPATWSYRLGPPVGAADAQHAARDRRGASAVIVRVELRYALRGVDRRPTTHDLWWTVVRRDGKPVIAADEDLSRDGGISWRGPWDFGRLDIVRTPHALVLGHPGDAGLDDAVAATVDRAVPTVTAVWGTGWSRQVAVVVPASKAELDAALGPAAGGPTEVGAIARADSDDPVSGTPIGQRVVVNPDELQQLSRAGRRIVLQHEVTHVATAARTTDVSPRWLVEGFAEYVGNLGSGQTVRTAAGELGRDVRRGVVPTGLPAGTAFESAGTAAQAYQSSWLACRLLAKRVGRTGLVRFYRQVGAAGGSSDAAVAAALRSVAGITPQQFVAAWRAYLREQLG